MARRRSRRKRTRGALIGSLRVPRIKLSELEQSQLDAIGLGIVGVGVFFSLVFYFGWDGGQVGEALADGFVFVFGRVAYLIPLFLLCAGAAVIFHPLLERVPPLKTGAALLLVGLMLGFAAESYGLGPGAPPRDGYFDPDHFTEHGGLVGETLYFAIASLFQRIGAHLAFTFLFASGLLLLTGASIATVVEITSGAFRDASRRVKRSTHEFARVVVGERERAKADAAGATVPYYDDPKGEPQVTALNEEETDDASFEDTEEDEAIAPSTPAGRFVREQESEDEEEEEIEATDDADLTPQGNRRSGITESEELDYKLPNPSILRQSRDRKGWGGGNTEHVAKQLVETLGHFGIESSIVGQVTGPRVTRYELSLAPGTKVSKVTQLKDDLAYALASTDIRIQAPIPGKQAVGVEVPNQSSRMVYLGDIFQRKITKKKAARRQGDERVEEGMAGASPLAVWLGKDISGHAVWTDLAKMPHLLVAGTTGSGKSGCVNTMLSSILLRATPNDVRMVLVDPKRVELNYYEDIPHLLTPVVTAPRMAANVLGNLIKEMENRYEVMGQARSRNIVELNRARTAAGEPPLPYILCVIDEFADLMMVAPTEVEDYVIRLAQKSRAVGIHLVLATQRPSVDVITGTIKVNVPARIAFAVSAQHDSRVILDQGGAESLLGQGDMLFRPVGSSKVLRVQGAYITEAEIEKITDEWRKQGEPEYEDELLEGREADEDSDQELSPDEDDLLGEAVALVAQTQTASVSMLQRRLRVGYTRAGRLIDMLERRGVISGYEGSKPRQVLISEAEVGRILGGDAPQAAPVGAPAVGPDDSDDVDDDY
jgi:S-DNA-T family DNA segregation ATPase FtsK/SpoIIIE